MKKLLVLLLTACLLSACSASHLSQVSDGDEVLFQGPKVKYTKNDLYKQLKNTDANAIVTDIMDRIALSDPSIDLEAIENEADELIQTYMQLGYESYIISQYGSVDAYRESYISTLLFQKLAKRYVNEKYDELIAEDKPVRMQVASFEAIENAEKCIEDFNNGSTFDMAAANNESLTTPSSGVYTDSDASLVYEVKEYLNSTNTTGISSIITNTVTTTDADNNPVDHETYYVLNIESRNPDEFIDDYLELKASEAEYETVRDYFLSTHEIRFYDQDLYELMTKEYEVLN